jgi:hypothetical protein
VMLLLYVVKSFRTDSGLRREIIRTVDVSCCRVCQIVTPSRLQGLALDMITPSFPPKLKKFFEFSPSSPHDSVKSHLPKTAGNFDSQTTLLCNRTPNQDFSPYRNALFALNSNILEFGRGNRRRNIPDSEPFRYIPIRKPSLCNRNRTGFLRLAASAQTGTDECSQELSPQEAGRDSVGIASGEGHHFQMNIRNFKQLSHLCVRRLHPANIGGPKCQLVQ